MAPTSPDSQHAFTYDLIVIGSGPAGQRAALQGSKAGKKVAIVESHTHVGGGCIHSGTLPSKSFRESVYRFSLGSRGTLGKDGSSDSRALLPDMQRLLKRRNRVVEGESQVISDQLDRNRIKVYSAFAKFAGPHELDLFEGGSKTPMARISGKFIFICVGARPVAPEHLPVDGRLVHDSNTILNLKRFPKSMVVLGAGIIGCEYASMFATGGTEVTLVDKRPQVLASVDREIVSHLTGMFQSQGLEILLSCEATQLEIVAAPRRKFVGRSRSAGEKVRVHLSNGKKIMVETVLVALGRAGNTDDLGLDVVGIAKDERGLVKVNQHFQTTVPHIYAVGDVVGAPALASTSMEQGRIACCHAFEIPNSSGGAVLDQKQNQSYAMPVLFPYGIYTIPEISMIGLTEEELNTAKTDFVVGRARYRELARGQIVGDRWGILKLLVDRNNRKLLGVHIIGDNAADLIHIGQAVMAFNGDVNYFISSVFNYPTLAEAYKTAAFHAVNQILGTTSSK
ncbi:MAG: Si-specific NAD(P)(+) transhydrogenase [Bdellovibrionales bacterium]|nr:Si-specific NAD(P)(+) transhydrogenase [Bdellovibrionales bacterium]